MQIARHTEQNAADAAAILAPLVGPHGARARAFMDLNRTSDTYGCADRPYWYYRTLTNFSGSTWQQVMLGLAALYKTPHAGNPYAGDPAVLEAAGAALAHWSRIAHADGAFDEWYLNEHSYCPTAITGAGAALTLDLIGADLPASVRDAALASLRKAGAWLDTRYNPTVMNQNLAAAVALAGLAKADASAEWRAAAERKLARVAQDQNAEGWFPEYGGADLGYSTLALDLLAAYHKLTGAERALEMARALCGFLVRVQGGWRALAGRLGSRGTSHGFPYGALYFAPSDANAAFLADTWLAGLAEGVAPSPAEVDDRYFAYFYFPQFALAYHHAAQAPLQRTSITTPSDQGDLTQSGFVAVKRDDWSALISRRLGGALAVSSIGGVHYHTGYEIETERGRFSSAVWSEEDVAPTASGVITARSGFRASSAGLPLKRFMAPFQLTVQFLATSALAEGFQGLIKRKMIAPSTAPGLDLHRTITVNEHGLLIRDELSPKPGLPRIKRLDIARTISMHSPSARQDRAALVEIPEARLAAACAALNSGAHTVLEFTLAIKAASVTADFSQEGGA